MPLVRVLSILVAIGVLSACDERGDGATLTAFDVELVQTSRCTLTGQAARNCDDPAVLAQTSLFARWYVEIGDDTQGVTLTTHEGRSMTGVAFQNDGSIIDTEGCQGEGGRCVFTRRRYETLDANNNNCQTFGELIFVGRHPPDEPDTLVGRFSDLNGNSEECGTPTVNEVAFSVSGEKAALPALSLTEANR